MTPEQKRIAIAEACGWRGISEQFLVGYAPWRTEPYSDRVNACSIADLDSIPLDPLPDYLNDLNAMHEAESKALRDGYSYWKFIELLDGLVKHGEHVDYVADRASATAAQRAEAFGKTLNLW
jgi:hypothetical protein